MYPSSIPRRKKVERELFDTLYSVGSGEFICKSQGNYLFTAEDERGEQLLLSIPDRLRNAFYFSSGDYVLCTPLENKKVRGEIRTVLYEKQIAHLIGLNSWPKNFPTNSSRKIQNQNEPYLSEDMLPTSDSSYDEADSDSIKEVSGSNSS
ncbi:probable RNA-binding protein EIF1AD [Clonorchis sinensis]|uniref:Probable RNA-binding protein EIF1AD n=1 Tax=Clonorchis sinensis TaxID=79923 RepID=G7YHQ8_CLOSI|nr:probable RNA-binding protein EIF1AD [Clonorchis sinensis]